MRDISEITRDWAEVPEGINFLNPAFETVNRQYISGLITEVGIFPSGEVHTVFRETYRFLYDAYQEMENRETGLNLHDNFVIVRTRRNNYLNLGLGRIF